MKKGIVGIDQGWLISCLMRKGKRDMMAESMPSPIDRGIVEYIPVFAHSHVFWRCTSETPRLSMSPVGSAPWRWNYLDWNSKAVTRLAQFTQAEKGTSSLESSALQQMQKEMSLRYVLANSIPYLYLNAPLQPYLVASHNTPFQHRHTSTTRRSPASRFSLEPSQPVQTSALYTTHTTPTCSAAQGNADKPPPV